jgi:hypothetical protein
MPGNRFAIYTLYVLGWSLRACCWQTAGQVAEAWKAVEPSTFVASTSIFFLLLFPIGLACGETLTIYYRPFSKRQPRRLQL